MGASHHINTPITEITFLTIGFVLQQMILLLKQMTTMEKIIPRMAAESRVLSAEIAMDKSCNSGEENRITARNLCLKRSLTTLATFRRRKFN